MEGTKDLKLGGEVEGKLICPIVGCVVSEQTVTEVACSGPVMTRMPCLRSNQHFGCSKAFLCMVLPGLNLINYASEYLHIFFGWAVKISPETRCPST